MNTHCDTNLPTFLHAQTALARANSTASSSEQVDELTDIVDGALTVPPTDMKGVIALLDLVLASDGEGLDPHVHTALGNIGDYLVQTESLTAESVYEDAVPGATVTAPSLSRKVWRTAADAYDLSKSILEANEEGLIKTAGLRPSDETRLTLAALGQANDLLRGAAEVVRLAHARYVAALIASSNR